MESANDPLVQIGDSDQARRQIRCGFGYGIIITLSFWVLHLFRSLAQRDTEQVAARGTLNHFTTIGLIGNHTDLYPEFMEVIISADKSWKYRLDYWWENITLLIRDP